MRTLVLPVFSLLAFACGSSTTPDDTSTVAPGDTTGTPSGDTGKPSGGTCAASTTCAQAEVLKSVELQDCDGNKVSLSDLFCGTKATVFAFGAGWCQPCREEQPTLQGWYAAHHAAGLQVVTILKEQSGPDDVATKTFCSDWKAQYKLDFPVLIDPTDKLTTTCLGTGGTLPVVLVVGPDGQVVYRDVGGDARDAEATFTELLDQ